MLLEQLGGRFQLWWLPKWWQWWTLHNRLDQVLLFQWGLPRHPSSFSGTISRTISRSNTSSDTADTNSSASTYTPANTSTRASANSAWRSRSGVAGILGELGSGYQVVG